MARTRARPLRLWLLLLGLLSSLAWEARPARGHALQPVVVTLSEHTPLRFTVEVHAPSGSPAPALRWPTHCRWANEAAQLDCAPHGLRGATLRLEDPGPEPREVFVVVRFLSPAPSLSDGAVESGVLRAPGDTWTLPLAPAGGGLWLGKGPSAPVRDTLRRYCALGVRHVLGGADHVLFVLALVLLLPSLRALVLALSAFTLAHSTALGLSTLGWVTPEPRWVEALIALSVLLLARELAHPPQPSGWTLRRPVLLPFACGLLHGLGFAGALAEIGLPRGQALLALFAFNGGVELGQLALVLVALGPLRWLGRARLRRPAAYTIGALAAAWTVERLVLFLSPGP